jgi:dTDP-4-amino-4,6-dideoxygalactose transaminase
VQFPVIRHGARHVFHLFVVQVDGREGVQQALAGEGIATGVHYPIPVHRQAAVNGAGRVCGELRVTESLVGRILSLPMYAELEPSQIEHVAASLCAVAAQGEN